MDNLTFDPVKVDTSLGKEYMQKKCVVLEEPKLETAWDFQTKTVVNINEIKLRFNNVSDCNQKLRRLCKKLEDNSELFCQLDYLMRKTDVDETRNCHMKLISQYFRLDKENFLNLFSKPFAYDQIVLEASTPLYYLGHIATVIRHSTMPVLICEKTTAPICQLFYELCSKVGLEISCYCINSSDCDKFTRRLPLPPMGCTLAITEEADMDSAVDVFLNSSEQAPWRIECIYVQESVYGELMDVLETRCERVPSERCVDAFRTRGRRVEGGAGAGAGGGVPVRAYRGARDLLPLLAAGAGGALSLWCGAAAAAHELALAAPSHLVWIDDYAAFDGPPSASIPFYNVPARRSYIPERVDDRLLKLQRTWTARSADERVTVVLDVLEKFSDPIMTELADHIAGWTPAGLVDIASDRITMVIDRPSTDIIICNNDMDMLELLKLMIRGYRVLIPDCYTDTIHMTYELCNVGLPITRASVSAIETPECTHEIMKKLVNNDKKVIHSRFGTIYSN